MGTERPANDSAREREHDGGHQRGAAQESEHRGRSEQGAADAGQAGAEDNGPQRRPARQQEKTGDANDAAGENDRLSAIAVGQRPPEDKHALLGEGTQPENQADKSA